MMPSPDRGLRILTVTHNYPRFSGDPAGAFVARIAEGAAARGHQVRVVAPHAPGIPEREKVAGVDVHRFRYAPEGLERVAYTGGLHQGTLRSPWAALALPGFLLAFNNAVQAELRRFAPSVVHAHWWFPSGWFVSRGSIPYMVTSHGSDVPLLERSGLVRRTAGRVFQRASRVTAVSQFLADDIKRLLPALNLEVVLTPMPVDVSRFLKGAGEPKGVPPRILYAGNLVPSKGVDVLLRAAAELSGRGVEYELKILGQGPSQDGLRALAGELNLDSRVTWSRFVPQAQMPAEYGASTITVLPTRGRAEGLGLTLVEALLAGSAAVGTPAGGIPEVVQHEATGLLARDGDAVDLANQLQRLLLDAGLRERLTRAGKEHVLQVYSPESATRRFLELYDAVAHNHAHR
jgi:glycosyltransferase involved in cell wall biosynthesis